jgi:hypothetical protein
MDFISFLIVAGAVFLVFIFLVWVMSKLIGENAIIWVIQSIKNFAFQERVELISGWKQNDKSERRIK